MKEIRYENKRALLDTLEKRLESVAAMVRLSKKEPKYFSEFLELTEELGGVSTVAQ